MNWADFLWGVHAGFWLGCVTLQVLLWLFNRKDN